MGSPEYPDDQIEFKPPSTNSLPMHGVADTESDDNDALTDNTINSDPYAGYQQLNMEDLVDDDDNDDGDEDLTNGQAQTIDPQRPTADTEIACQVWNAPRPIELDIKMDSTKSDEIKSVMSKVKLDAIQPPEWAINIPEAKWIDELLQEVRRNKSSDNHSSNIFTRPEPIPGPSSNQ